jgi:hypothetical protein
VNKESLCSNLYYLVDFKKGLDKHLHKKRTAMRESSDTEESS